MKETWIAVDNSYALWAFIALSAAIAIIVEQKYKWAARLSGAVIALIIALFSANFGLVPHEAPVYDVVWGYIVPMSIPLLLFQINIRSIFKESGRLLIIFLLSSMATVIGVVIAFFVLKEFIPELAKVSGMMSASYTGGGVNFAAMVAKLEPSKSLTASTTVADNLMMVAYIIILMMLSSSRLMRKTFNPVDSIGNNDTQYHNSAENYWKPNLIGLKDIAINISLSLLLVSISFSVSDMLKGYFTQGDTILGEIIYGLFTDKYLLLTSFTFIALLLFPNSFSKMQGSSEIGTFGIYMFFVVIGLPASIPEIIHNAPLLFIFVFIIMMINLLVALFFGKILKFKLEEILLVCNANIGGPTTAAAFAIGKGWRNLIGPILVVGTVGYVVGNYIGTIVYTILSKF